MTDLDTLDADCSGSGAPIARGGAVICHCGAAWYGQTIPRHQPHTHGYGRPTGFDPATVKRIRKADAKEMVKTHYIQVAVRPFFDELSLREGAWWAIPKDALPDDLRPASAALATEESDV